MLMVIGASHHDLDLHQLERLSEHAVGLRSALSDLVRAPGSPVSGAVMLSTCNRLEIYLDARLFHDAVDAVTATVAAVAGVPADEVATVARVRVGAPVAAHLFTVASGLDSMVVGEAEISGQVSRALSAAQAAGTTTPPLHTLFQSALRTARRVTAGTPLGSAGRSVVTVALDLVEPAPAPGGSALVIGTGAYARVSVAALRARGVTDIRIHSASGRAQAFADAHQAQAVPAGQLVEALAKVDLVVSCSGGRAAALDGSTVAAAVALRPSPLRIVDLALPADVPEDVRALPGVVVVDLRTVAVGVAPEHREAITAAQDVVIDAVARFEDEQAARQLDPAVVALRRHVSGAVQKELDRLRAKYDGDVAAEVELSLHRVTQSLLHTPTLRARELARTGDAAHYLQALHTLFGIELPAGTGTAEPHG
ncbi:glutamyl-tRNA reductase [Nakamurella endophytica]|uniref:Glutamyl-tRNA reductase n=1 Tax=Nakamurella endophytica TaxID=1748367 RepID=A0A917SKN5_9ACTN|nr:glutamyl-tRNA reductase [Nakamurella endophytica]GGL84620.1 glutamyl-tRNA reductase [Nakamurella endophytica]